MTGYRKEKKLQRGSDRHEAHGNRRVLICPNAFKGSLTAAQAAEAIDGGIRTAGRELPVSEISTVQLPLADGGDGTLETLVEATGGAIHRMTVRGPLGAPVNAAWGRLGGSNSDTAVIEMAAASGLRLLRPDAYDARRASTYGTGELMSAAIEAGCRTLIVGIGGSATNDGGAGMAQALGARLLNRQGRGLPPGGAALRELERIDVGGVRLPRGVKVRVACDVDNPLIGADGASAIYGPQKGADAAAVAELESALRHYGGLLKDQLGADVANAPGAGAAGGLGAGLMAFCGAKLEPGTELILDVTGFDECLKGCWLVVTGEGRLDGQTARGKVIAGVARHARAQGVPVVAIAGTIDRGAEELLRPLGLTVALATVDGPMSLEAAIGDAYRLLAAAAERAIRLVTIV